MDLDRWNKELKNIDNNLYLQFDDLLDVYEVRHKIPFTNIDRRIMRVTDEFGDKREMGMDIINTLKYNYDWSNIYKYKDTNELCDFYLTMMQKEKAMKEKYRDSDRKDAVKEHIKYFENILNKARSTMSKEEVKVLKREVEKYEFERSKRPLYY